MLGLLGLLLCGAFLTNQVVPDPLLDFCFNVMRSAFSVTLNRPVYAFKFDRFMEVTPAILEKVSTRLLLFVLVLVVVYIGEGDRWSSMPSRFGSFENQGAACLLAPRTQTLVHYTSNLVIFYSLRTLVIGGGGQRPPLRDGDNTYVGQVLHAQARRAAAQARHQPPRESRDTRRQQRRRGGNQARMHALIAGSVCSGFIMMITIIIIAIVRRRHGGSSTVLS